MTLYEELVGEGFDFFVGVPDSGLKGFIEEAVDSDLPHVIAAHESQAMGIAVGAMLAGRNPVVYLQNSGLGNLVNPITSLCDPASLYPMLIIGHRHTLPQHKTMGEIDAKLMRLLKYPKYRIVYGENNAS